MNISLLCRFVFAALFMVAMEGGRKAHAQDLPDIHNPKAHLVLFDGEWEPAGQVQDYIGFRVPDQFYEVRIDPASEKYFKDILSIAQKKGLKPIGYGRVKDTYVRFMAGREIGRSVRDYPFALFASEKGILLQVSKLGTDETPEWSDQCVVVFPGRTREGDLLFVRHGVNTPPIAFQRAMVRPPKEKEKKSD